MLLTVEVLGFMLGFGSRGSDSELEMLKAAFKSGSGAAVQLGVLAGGCGAEGAGVSNRSADKDNAGGGVGEAAGFAEA